MDWKGKEREKGIIKIHYQDAYKTLRETRLTYIKRVAQQNKAYNMMKYYTIHDINHGQVVCLVGYNRDGYLRRDTECALREMGGKNC